MQIDRNKKSVRLVRTAGAIRHHHFANYSICHAQSNKSVVRSCAILCDSATVFGRSLPPERQLSSKTSPVEIFREIKGLERTKGIEPRIPMRFQSPSCIRSYNDLAPTPEPRITRFSKCDACEISATADLTDTIGSKAEDLC